MTTMEENQLGKNIKHLRKSNSEKQVDLASLLGFHGSEISQYEAGKRTPNLETLETIAAHYSTTIDDLIKTDMSGIGNKDLSFRSFDQIEEVFLKYLPLMCSESSLDNQIFARGYGYCKQIIHQHSTGIIPLGKLYFEGALDAFNRIIQDDGTQDIRMEAVANKLWIIFAIGGGYSTVNIEGIYANRSTLETKMLGNLQPFIKAIQQIQTKVSPEAIRVQEAEKNKFIEQYDEEIVKCIKTLKSDPAWSDLGDYYFALWYDLSLVKSKHSQEIMDVVAQELMDGLKKLGNKYAIQFEEQAGKYIQGKT